MLVQLDEIKKYLKINSSTHDDLLDNVNARVQELIENIINQKIDLQTHYKLYSMKQSNSLVLDDMNIKNINLIATDLDLSNKTYGTEITEYFYDTKSGIIEFVDDYDIARFNMYVEYNTEINDAGIKEIILSTIAKKYYDIDQKRFGINSKNVMNENVSYSYSDITSENRNYLKQYKKYPGSNGINTERFTSA